MSADLYIKINGAEVYVYQVPSHITVMCLMTADGWDAHLKGKKAKRAVRSYLAWVKHTYPESKEELLWDAINSGKEIEAYAL